MDSRPESSEAFVRQLLPSFNPDPTDRALAWCEWYGSVGERCVMAFIKTMNDSAEPDNDILQDAMATAYAAVERGDYKPCVGVPFTAYVKGIARNKIREARRRARNIISLEEMAPSFSENIECHPESLPDVIMERREQRYELQMGLSKLTHCRKRVLEGYIRGESTGEIANALGMSEELVRQHKSRGLRSLRQMNLMAA